MHSPHVAQPAQITVHTCTAGFTLQRASWFEFFLPKAGSGESHIMGICSWQENAVPTFWDIHVEDDGNVKDGFPTVFGR